MGEEIRVLLLEDSEKDAELILSELRRAGLEPEARRVDAEADFARALSPDLDLILADYTLPEYDGLKALRRVRESGLDVPFILVTGTIGEEAAVALMLEGAFAAVLKSRLKSLGPLAKRALEERAVRAENRRVHAALAEEVDRRRAVEDSMTAGLMSVDLDGRVDHVNAALCRLLGYEREELIGLRAPFPFWPPEAGPELETVFWNTVRGGRTLSAFELQVQRRNGNRLDIQLEVSPLRNSDGGLKGAVALVYDITDRKRAEAEREFRRTLLRTQQETSLDGILVVDDSGRVVTSNARFAQMWGLKPDVLALGDDEPVLRAVVEQVQDPSEFLKRVERLYANKDERSHDEVRHKDGRVFDRYSSPMVGAGGRYLGRVWYFRDVTDAKRAQEEQARYARALKTLSRSNEALVRAQSEADLLEKICEIVVKDGGYAAAWVGCRVDDEEKSVEAAAMVGDCDPYVNGARVTWADTERGRGPTGVAIREGSLQVGRDFENDPRLAPWRQSARKHGLRSSIAVPLRLEGAVFGALTIYSRDADAFNAAERRLLEDLAEDLAYGVSVQRAKRRREEAERALRESERRLADAQRIARLGSWEWRVAENRVSWSDELYAILGRAPGSIGDYPGFLACVHPDDRVWVDAANQQALAGRPYRCDFRVLRPDGEVRFVHVEGELARDAEGRPLVLKGAVLDVTERERAQAALREAREHYRIIVENSRDLIALVDAEGKFTFASPSYEPGLGYKPADLVGRPMFDLARPERVEELAGLMAESQRTPGPIVVETECRHKDGSWRWFEVSGVWLRDADRPVQGMIISRDVTERKRLQEQVYHSQRMESVGVLAGGVAHDFNNILMTILANCSFLLDSMSHGDPRRSEVDEIRLAGERAAALTRQLLIFSRKQTVQAVPVDLNGLIRNLQKMLGRVLGEDIKLEIAPAAEALVVLADPSQLEQVVMNLAVNARDAMPRGGKLAIRTRRGEHGAACLCDGKRAAGGCAVLEAEDTGCGMAPEVQEHVFEPFFTTKPAGKGTGLGLSTVYGIVKQAGGGVAVRSEPGKGTTFTVDLPLAPAEAALPAPAPEPAPESGRGGETILLVEDDETLRKIDRRVLEESGYKVVSARDGEEALQVLQDGGKDAALLLTDVVMPGIDGGELARRALALRPGLPVIFISGYVEHKALEAVQKDSYDLLEKPVRPDVLARKVREVLDRRAAGSR